MHQSLFQFPLCSALDFIYQNSCQSEGEVCSPLPCTSAFSDKQMDLSVSLYANCNGVRPENRQQADTWDASQAVFLTKCEAAGDVSQSVEGLKKYLQVTFHEEKSLLWLFIQNCQKVTVVPYWNAILMPTSFWSIRIRETKRKGFKYKCYHLHTKSAFNMITVNKNDKNTKYILLDISYIFLYTYKGFSEAKLYRLYWFYCSIHQKW